MRTLIRTIVIYLVAFVLGQVAPPKSIIIPLLSLVIVTIAMVDFMLYILRRGRGLFHNLED